MILALAPDARLLLIKASREVTFSRRARPIEDIAGECGISEHRLDAILAAFMREGLWSCALRPRQGYVTRKGLAYLQQGEPRAA